MMITVRHLLVVSFLTLLSGCAIGTGVCHYPSQLPIYPSWYATTASKCTYFLTVTKIKKEEGWVMGKYPQDLIKDSHADPDRKYKFLVSDLDWWVDKKQLVEGQDYIFIGNPDSPFLQPFFAQGYEEENYEDENKRKGYKTTP